MDICLERCNLNVCGEKMSFCVSQKTVLTLKVQLFFFVLHSLNGFSHKSFTLFIFFHLLHKVARPGFKSPPKSIVQV